MDHMRISGLSRLPFRLQDLYSFAYIVHFLGLDETIGRYLVPTNGITWRDVYYCLPALHLYLRIRVTAKQ